MIKGFTDMSIHSRGKAFFDIFLKDIGGHGYNRNLPAEIPITALSFSIGETQTMWTTLPSR
jgi:hypothetical protein